MQKKGFTLIELLGVLVVLSIILIVAVPSTIATLKRAGVKEYNAFLTNLYTATESYVELNRSLFPQLDLVNGRVDIPAQTLLDQGLIKKMGIDPDTGIVIPNTYTVVATTQTDFTVKYTISNLNTNIKSYAQTGLILQYDAINNVGEGHSKITTVWNDLSTYHNDILGINPTKWNDNSLTFDGFNLISKNIIDPALLGKNITMEIFLLSNTDKFVHIGLNRGNDANNGIGLKIRAAADGRPWWNCYPINTQQYAAPDTFTANGTSKYSFVYRNNFTGSTASKFFNNRMTAASVSNITSLNERFQIGYSTENLMGKIYSIRLYNRALSDAEITSNYNLDLNRFR